MAISCCYMTSCHGSSLPSGQLVFVGAIPEPGQSGKMGHLGPSIIAQLGLWLETAPALWLRTGICSKQRAALQGSTT